MLQSIQGSLVIVGLNTPTPSYLWNGIMLEGVLSLHASVDSDDNTTNNKVKLIISGTQEEVYAEMRLAGIIVKKAKV